MESTFIGNHLNRLFVPPDPGYSSKQSKDQIHYHNHLLLRFGLRSETPSGLRIRLQELVFGPRKCCIGPPTIGIVSNMGGKAKIAAKLGGISSFSRGQGHCTAPRKSHDTDAVRVDIRMALTETRVRQMHQGS